MTFLVGNVTGLPPTSGDLTIKNSSDVRGASVIALVGEERLNPDHQSLQFRPSLFSIQSFMTTMDPATTLDWQSGRCAGSQ